LLSHFDDHLDSSLSLVVYNYPVLAQVGTVCMGTAVDTRDADDEDAPVDVFVVPLVLVDLPLCFVGGSAGAVDDFASLVVGP
jgi:hypothetical protein